MAEEISFRPASDSDFAWLLKLRITTMSDYLIASHEHLSLDDQRARVQQDFDAIQIISSDGHDIGMLKLLKQQEFWTVVQVQLLPEWQGQGIGFKILSDILSDAAAAQVSVKLSVLKVNPAKHLYDRLGFKVIEEKGHSYEMRIDP